MHRGTVLALGGLVVTIAAIGAIVVWLLSDRGDGRHTYRNARFGYEIRYPSDWSIENLRDPAPGDDFLTQYVTFKPPGSEPLPKVLASVNFQGGWCESGKQQTSDISLRGVRGKRYDCDLDGDGREDQLVLFFPETRAGVTYLINGTWDRPQDGQTIQRVASSFRFR